MNVAEETATGTAAEINNVGAIKHLTLPMPEGGAGLIILQGRNGSGKTTAINAIGKMLNGDGTAPTPRDGTERGSVTGFGVRLTVAKSTRRSGELEVVTLESGKTAAELVDPGVADPAAADAKRIKALIALTGQVAEPAAFHKIVDGGVSQFNALFSGLDIDAEDDPLKLAGRLKRSAEAQAREAESEADKSRGEAIAQAAAASLIDGEPVDQKGLDDAVEAALKARHGLTVKQDVAAANQKRADDARKLMEEAKANEDRWGIPEATNEQARRKMRLNQAEIALASAKMEYEEAEKEVEEAGRWVSQAHADAQLFQQWEETIKAGEVPGPTPEEVAAADQAVAAARQAVTDNTLRRQAANARVSAKTAEDRAAAWGNSAAAFRLAASKVDDVLSEFVAGIGSGLCVVDGRLRVKNERGLTPFAELSHGERWKLAIDICVAAVGATGVLTIPQEAYEGLDEDNRAAIVQHLKARGVLAVTAEASAGDITAIAV